MPTLAASKVGLPDTVMVLVAEPSVASVLLPLCVTVMVQNAPAGAVAKVPVTLNCPPTTAVAVVQLPPPVATAVMAAIDGVSSAGTVSVKVVVPVTGPLFVTVSKYCTVPPPGTVTLAEVGALTVSVLWVFPA